MVDGRHAMLLVEDVHGVDLLQLRRLVGLEQVGFERAREQVAVDAEEDVTLGIPGGQERVRERLACVPGLEDPKRLAARRLELALHVVRDHEGVVRDEHDLLRVAAPAAGDECDREDGDREDGAGGVQHAPIEVHAASSVSGPGRMARRMPFPTATRAVVATNSFETPRLEPGSSVSPSSG